MSIFKLIVVNSFATRGGLYTLYKGLEPQFQSQKKQRNRTEKVAQDVPRP